jgi:hypothetical protein
LETNPTEIESKAEHEKVPKEEAVVETFRALKKQHTDQHLAIKCRSKGPRTMVCPRRSWPSPAEG